MIGPPRYFEAIREQASRRWDQLEADPELAGPWHQLFKQVQSPRHVLSELLQNADDAGATEAAVRIQDRTFIFQHNGQDFTEEHFASLCRFGYSNKRGLHTIGFRGIGFKCTFSLGDRVELFTPTLSVAFDRARFTEPKWIGDLSGHEGQTQIRVKMRDPHRIGEIEKNLHEWLQNPVSLLFFRNLRGLRVYGQPIHWSSIGPGPVPAAEWMTLQGHGHSPLLLIRSEAERFPEEAVREIREERLLRIDEEGDFPPCRVEIVLHEIVLQEKGRLYVVLPTGVETELSFACNAPFIQDPARVKIKDPETSPTNRWLLSRAAVLAASTMRLWLEQMNIGVEDRARAYAFVPDVDAGDRSIAGTCGTIVDEIFKETLSDCSLLLTNSGDLKRAGQCVILPDALVGIWEDSQTLSLLDPQKRSPLSCHVSESDRQRLVRWGVVEELSKKEIFASLQTVRLPRPENWANLLRLWSYVGNASWQAPFIPVRPSFRMAPVHGRNVLCSGDEAVRLSEKRLLHSESDWQFLASHLSVLNQNWLRFLAEQRRVAENNEDMETSEQVATALRVLGKLELDEVSDVTVLVDMVARAVLCRKPLLLSTLIKLTQIAARLDATVCDTFRFVTRDLKLHSKTDNLIFDADGTLEAIVPAAWVQTHFLHESYSRSFESCTREEWLNWASSGRAGLFTFAPLSGVPRNIYTRHDLRIELQDRGCEAPDTFPYKTTSFVLEDRDFDDQFWEHWNVLALEDDRFWGRLVERVLTQPTSYWLEAATAKVLQKSSSGVTKPVLVEGVPTRWILKLRELRCLPDTHGTYRLPSDLLRRTPATEPLRDVEPFVHARLDTETTRPLLDLLGVRHVPTGPERILQCLRALTRADHPPIHEVRKWYERLDELITTCTTVELSEIKQAFHDEKIVLTQDCGWTNAAGAFLAADEEDAPGSALVFDAVRDLTLWRRIGVAERPSADRVIHWLKELQSGSPLSPDDARRVRALLPRHPLRIHSECGHWLNLAREWAPVDSLDYALTMQALVEWGHLDESVKQRTADLQRLPGEVTSAPPFSDWPLLSDRIEERVHRNPRCSSVPEHKPWLNELGALLRRIVLEDKATTARVRQLAADLEETVWQVSTELEVLPYLDGAPAGAPRLVDVMWLDRVLYMDSLPAARLARLVPDRVGRIFGRPEITAAMSYCFSRSKHEVAEYIEQNFVLEPLEFCQASSDVVSVLGAKAGSQTRGDAGLSLLGTMTELGSGPEDKNGEPAPLAPDGSTLTLQQDLDGATDRPTPADVAPPTTGLRSKAPRESIIERYFNLRGFIRSLEGQFRHPDGSVIVRSPGDLFPWAEHNESGELVCHYWAKEVCLECQPLELDVEIWGMIHKFPELHAMILTTPGGEPVEYSGKKLCEFVAARKLILHQATYRLVLHQDEHEEP